MFAVISKLKIVLLSRLLASVWHVLVFVLCCLLNYFLEMQMSAARFIVYTEFSLPE